MINNETNTIIQEFLEKLEGQGFVGKINSKLLHDDYTKEFPATINAFTFSLSSIIEQYEAKKINFGISDSDMTIFVCFSQLNLVNAFLEFIKKMLLILILKDKIPQDSFKTYGQIIAIWQIN